MGFHYKMFAEYLKNKSSTKYRFNLISNQDNQKLLASN